MTLKRLSIGLAVISILLFLLSTFMSVKLFIESWDFFQPEKTTDEGHPLSHFVLILPDDPDPFYLRIEETLKDEARGHAVVETFRNRPSLTGSSVTDYMDKMVYAHVDGFFLCLPDGPGLKVSVDHAVASGIPVVCLVSDIAGSRRQSFVGTNSFQWGLEVGKVLQKIPPVKGTIDVVLGSPGNLLLSGLQRYLQERPGFQIREVRQAGPNPGQESEELVWKVLSSSPPQVLICTSARDTLNAIQSLVELNKVGNTSVIGFDDSPEIRRDLESGLLFATLIPHPQEMAKEAFQALWQLSHGQNVSSFFDAPLTVVTKEVLESASREAPVER